MCCHPTMRETYTTRSGWPKRGVCKRKTRLCNLTWTTYDTSKAWCRTASLSTSESYQAWLRNTRKNEIRQWKRGGVLPAWEKISTTIRPNKSSLWWKDLWGLWRTRVNRLLQRYSINTLLLPSCLMCEVARKLSSCSTHRRDALIQIPGLSIQKPRHTEPRQAELQRKNLIFKTGLK